ncbi:hypothetical protein BGZ76_003437 [Entomortierella beljakovae]|nr:hypothetical protein BGZ76_003437 [Entomortierella beljakovae]
MGWENGRALSSSPETERDDPTAQYYYYPATLSSQRYQSLPQLSPLQQPSPQQYPQDSLSQQQSPTVTGAIIIPTRNISRRHSVSSASPWSSIPPRHALHMPVMKIDPAIWRSESHQRDIHRLLHDGRNEEVMKRRGLLNVMDTTEEGEEEEENDMSGVVNTIDLGGFRASEEREKEQIRQQVRNEWANIVAEQSKEYELALQRQALADEAKKREVWANQLEQQQLQQQILQRQQLSQFKIPNQVQLNFIQQQQQQQHQQQHFPEQFPVPGQQQQQQQRTQFGQTTCSQPNPTVWAAPPAFAIDTRRPSFTTYRG